MDVQNSDSGNVSKLIEVLEGTKISVVLKMAVDALKAQQAEIVDLKKQLSPAPQEPMTLERASELIRTCLVKESDFVGLTLFLAMTMDENNKLCAELETLRSERDAYRDGWAKSLAEWDHKVNRASMVEGSYHKAVDAEVNRLMEKKGA